MRKRGIGRANVPEIEKGRTVFKASTSYSHYNVVVDGSSYARLTRGLSRTLQLRVLTESDDACGGCALREQSAALINSAVDRTSTS